MSIQRVLRIIAGLAVLGVLLALGYRAVFGTGNSTSYTAYFDRSTGLYTGDEVKVLGVKVGEVDSITPRPSYVAVRFHVDEGVDVPANVSAAIVAPNLVTSRFVQLSPAYTSGPKLAAGATIKQDHTAEPIEWDQLKTELTRLARSLGPNGADSTGALGGTILTADSNLTGNAGALRSMLHNLSQASETLAANRDNLFGTVRALESFISNLVRSDSAVRAFSSNLADMTGLLAQNRNSLGLALDELDGAVGQLKTFIANNRSAVSKAIASVSTLTTTLNAKQYQLADLLHVSPVALDNFYNIVDPRYHAATGTIAAANFDDMAQLVCRMIVSTGGTVDTCLSILNPLLKQIGLNGLPKSTQQAALQGAQQGAAAAGSTPPPSKPVSLPTTTTGLIGLLLPGGGS